MEIKTKFYLELVSLALEQCDIFAQFLLPEYFFFFLLESAFQPNIY